QGLLPDFKPSLTVGLLTLPQTESRGMKSQIKDPKEQAYLFDLYVVPQWREVFDRLVDEEVELPKAGKLLDAECGTGGYAIDLALRIGKKAEVVGVDASEE